MFVFQTSCGSYIRHERLISETCLLIVTEISSKYILKKKYIITLWTFLYYQKKKVYVYICKFFVVYFRVIIYQCTARKIILL